MAAVSFLAIVKPWWSCVSWPSAGWWHSRQLTPFFGVAAQLVLVDDGVLQVGVALGALARGADEGGGRLLGDDRAADTS